MKNIFDLYIRSSIHVALAVASFTLLTAIHLKLPINTVVVLFSFFAAITGYNFIKYAHFIGKPSKEYSAELKFIFVLTLVSATLLLFLSFYLEFSSLVLTSILGLLVLLYPNTSFNRIQNLRQVTGFKIFLISAVWAGLTVLLPALEANHPLTFALWSEFIQRILFVILLTIPFDLRDLRIDYGHIKTIPTLIGVQNTKVLSSFLSVTIIILEILFPVKSFPLFMIQIVMIGMLLVLILRLPLYQSKFFASFWIEGVPIAWLIVSIAYLFC